MPIYEYRCQECGHTYEKLMRLGATEAPPCPACGSTGARRLISMVARTSAAGETASACGSSGGT